MIEGSFLALLTTIVFLLLLFLLELVLLEHLPKLTELRLIVECSLHNFLQVVAGSHGALVMWAKLSVQDYFCYFDVSQGFLTATQQEEAGCKIIENTGCLDVLQA